MTRVMLSCDKNSLPLCADHSQLWAGLSGAQCRHRHTKSVTTCFTSHTSSQVETSSLSAPTGRCADGKDIERFASSVTGAQDLVQGLKDENVMEIGEVQSVYVGILNEAVSRRSACVVESFEGVSLKAPRRSYGCYERVFFFAGSVTPVVCDAGLRE